MSRSGKGDLIGMRCTECNAPIHMQYRTAVMKQEGKKVSESKKFCRFCRKHVELKEFTKFHYSDAQKKKKSRRNKMIAAGELVKGAKGEKATLVTKKADVPKKEKAAKADAPKKEKAEKEEKVEKEVKEEVAA